MIFVNSDQSQLIKRIDCAGCENTLTCRVDFDGNFSKRKIYGHSLEEARQIKKVRAINEVLDVGRDRECEEGEDILLTMELVI